MHEMQTIVIDDRGVCQSVCRVAWLGFTAKTAERIKMLFGMNTPGGPWNIVLDAGPVPPQRRGSWGKYSQLWTHYISRELLKLETSNCAYV